MAMQKSRAATVQLLQESSSAITLERARALLGREAETMTDDDVRRACRSAETLAHIIVQMFLDSRSRPPGT